MGELRIRLLGGLEVEGIAPTALGSRKARTLVKLLALRRGTAVSADAIVEALWPGGDADRVQVLFVTVDPERDTPELLSHYVPAFNPTFLGLSGDAAATAETAREFKVLYQKQAGSTPGSYSMDHTAGTFIFDPAGRLRLFVSQGQGPQVFAHDIRELLRATS